MSLWRVARLDVNKLCSHDRDAVVDWVASLGQEPKRLRPQMSVSQDEGDGAYRLHLSRFVLNDKGEKQVDHAIDEIWSEPVVIPLEELPEWLLPVYSKYLAEQNGAT